MKKYSKIMALLLVIAMTVTMLAGCGASKQDAEENTAGNNTLIYGSNDYTRINPAIDEHGEINLLLFDGLTAHDKDGKVVPGLAESWDYDEATKTYTFKLHNDVKWHDGEAFTADDVKFTIEAIMNPDNESEIACNYEDIENIEVVDDQTIKFTLANKNVAFLEYMTIGILPKHLLEGKDMQNDDYFRFPIGTGPYKMSDWTEGQSITLVKNEDYYQGAPNIDTIVFKIVEDDNAKALQLKSGELNFSQITPKDAAGFTDDEFTIYNMKTADYRGIMYNFNNEFWKKHKAVIPAINYAIDRQAMVDSVLLGQGITAYSPIQRNEFNDDSIEKFDFDQAKAKEIIEADGWTLGDDGIYQKDGERLSFTVNCKEGDQVRVDLAQVASQQLKEVGVECKVAVASKIDWENQEAFLIGWGSPFDADDHTYKVFGTDKGNNYSYYSNADVDAALTNARQTDDAAARKQYYSDFLKAMTEDPAYTFFCYVDVDYISNVKITGITEDTVLGHHGVGIFWNVKDWTLE